MKRLLVHLLVGVTALLSFSCAQNPKSAQAKQNASSEAFAEPDGKREFLQRELMNFADRFASSTAATYDELAVAVKTPEAKRLAIERKVSNAESAFANATE